MAERGRRGRGRGGRGRGAQEVPLFGDAADMRDVPVGDVAAMQAQIDYLQQRLARWEPVEGVDVGSESATESEEDAAVNPFGQGGFRNHGVDQARDFGIRVDIPEWDDEPIFDEYPEEEILDGDGHENVVVRKILFEDNEVEEDSEGLEYREPKYDEYADDNVLCGDGHESLVVRESLLIPKGCSPDDWLRNDTTCTIKGNICTMIVDGSNCDNIVSDETGEKLKLRTEPQPKPYKLSWLNKGSEVIVDKRCLVSFSIGNTYHDGHWCDVEKMIYALIPDESRTNDESIELPIAGRELLVEFANLMPEDLPPDPPPLRDKLMDREVDLCKVVQKINNRLRLPNHLKSSDVFSVEHLTRCFEELGTQMQTRGRVFSNQGRMMQREARVFRALIWQQHSEPVSECDEIW